MIFSENDFAGDVKRSCLKNDSDFARFFTAVDLDEIPDDDKASHLFVIETADYIDVLKHYGIDENNMIVLFGKKAIKDIFKNLKILSFRHWLAAFFRNYVKERIVKRLVNKFPKLIPVFEKYDIKRNAKKDIMYLKRFHADKKIVFFGFNEFTEHYLKIIEHEAPEILYGVILDYNPDRSYKIDERYKKYVKKIDELFYEQPDSFLFYITDRQAHTKIEGTLVENGFSAVDIFKNGRRKIPQCSTRFINAYDPLLGYARNEDDHPGFAIFENKISDDENDVFKIAVLGGSTSDPYVENIKSWPETLCEMLKELKIPAKIYSGGVSSYTVSQEVIKLIRDCIVIRPDLILSYSGINDIPMLDNGFGRYDVEAHPYIRDYMPDIFSKLIKHGKIKNTYMSMLPLTDLSLGVQNNKSKADFWIDCEKIMSLVCKGFNIEFHGFFQPVNKTLLTRDILFLYKNMPRINSFFENVSAFISQEGENLHIHDFTHIFDGHDNVYYDCCHVYEKGNRIIAQKILPFVLNAIENKNRRKI